MLLTESSKYEVHFIVVTIIYGVRCNNFNVDINFMKLRIDANVNRITSGGRRGKGINLTAYSFTLKRKATFQINLKIIFT